MITFNHKLFYSTVLIIGISFLIYQLKFIVVNLEIGPIKFEAPIENVFNCFKNQFYEDRLWKEFDYENTKEKIDIDKNRSNSTHLFFTMTQLAKIFDFIDYRLRVILDSEMVIDHVNHVIKINSVSRDGMVETNYYIKLEEAQNGTIVMESSNFTVFRIFGSFTKKVAEIKHTNILQNIKNAIELDKNLCILNY